MIHYKPILKALS